MNQHRTPRTSAPGTARALGSVVLGALLVLPLSACSGDDGAAAGTGTSSGSGTATGDGATATDGSDASAGSGTDAPATDDPATDEATDTATATSSGSVPGGAVGSVVEGFPTDVVPMYPGAEVLSTVATEDGEQRDVSLNGRTSDAPDAVVEFYRQSLVAAGFTESAAPSAEGVTAATFSRSSGAELVQVAVVGSGGSQQFTVGGSINR